MSRLRVLLPLFMVSVFFLFGCTPEEKVQSFSLSRMGIDDDPKIPQLYSVSPPEDEEKLSVFYPNDVYTQTEGYHEVYALDAVTVNDEEIRIAFKGEVLRFNRLSSTIAETEEEQIWYQYIDLEEQEAMH